MLSFMAGRERPGRQGRHQCLEHQGCEDRNGRDRQPDGREEGLLADLRPAPGVEAQTAQGLALSVTKGSGGGRSP
jgi:hypothetical protein